LFEGKVLRQMPAFVVAPQQVQGGRVANFQRPQVEDALHTHTHTHTDQPDASNENKWID
jgi:hypothetical protein